jgi:2,3-bisphosphoglycerate-independent phosphoglycerate mutase
MARILLLFLDGVGLGDDDAARNPLAAARLPTCRALLDGAAPVRGAAPHRGAGALLLGLDATFGVPGLPQSGTGQTALLTGQPAPRLVGRHMGPWVPTRLRPLLAAESILARAAAAGLDVAFANAYPEELFGRPAPAPAPGAAAPRPFTPPRAHRGRPDRLPLPLRVGPAFAAHAAGLLVRHTPALARGDAVASELTNDGWRDRLRRTSLPAIDAAAAGRNLARIAARHHLTLFAHYATDTAGHLRELAPAVRAIERVDAFLAGVLAALPGDVLLVIASDHGNLEDAGAAHTRNPALFLAAGAGHDRLAAGGLRTLADVAPALLRLLGVGAAEAGKNDGTAVE